ncbi:Hint domain-containing protein [Undibacterium umbellatum]|uniref:Uncharacterized protein n=1 Tax=Undibacterium umbellatum TaxID=2762300 RepID=A0ABR6Z6Q6_9BURK|nr:hypothetical protein [Undibacterium umbellatum]MBC3907422.1 hypothetical protein [Undibacterium umbellatum]
MNLDSPEVSMNTSGGFAGGTLIHTKDGLRRIDTIKVGDLILVPNGPNGESTYKPVARISKSDHAVMVAADIGFCEHEYPGFKLVFSGLPAFLVFGIVPDYPEDEAEEYRSSFGWMSVDSIHVLYLLASSPGKHATFGSKAPLWKTNDANVAFELFGYDSEIGYQLTFKNGEIVDKKTADCDLFHDDDFSSKDDSPEDAEQCAYKDTAFSIETADVDPFFVGEGGLLVYAGRGSAEYKVWAYGRIWE